MKDKRQSPELWDDTVCGECDNPARIEHYQQWTEGPDGDGYGPRWCLHPPSPTYQELQKQNAELRCRLAIADALLCRVVDESGRTYEQGDPVRGVAPRFSLVFPAGDELWGSLKIYRNGLLNAYRAETGREVADRCPDAG